MQTETINKLIMNSLYNTYPDIISVVIIPMIIALFTIALPLLLPTITRIDEKYGSTKLIETFKKDRRCTYYIFSVIFSIVSLIIWSLQLPRIVDGGCLNGFIDHSAFIFLSAGVVWWIIMIFFILHLTYVYYYPDKLLNRLIEQEKKASQTYKLLYFCAISKIYLYAIRIIDVSLRDKIINDFYYSKFGDYKKGKECDSIDYPIEYYNSFFEINELLCSENKKIISRVYINPVFDLFLDGHHDTLISTQTYDFIWRCLLQILTNGRNDYFMHYWQTMHQYVCTIDYQIHHPVDNNNELDSADTSCQNNARIEKLTQEKGVLLNFHYAVGGLLLSLQNYELVRCIMSYTHQNPPKYVLVPEKMEDVISRYIDVPKVYSEDSKIRYLFPDTSGVNANDILQMWIKRYLVILFLRQYTIHPAVNDNALSMPTMPDDENEKNPWLNALHELKGYVYEYLSDREIIERIGFSMLFSDRRFEENDPEHPMIQNIIDSLN
jgi:hypothetical protein